MRPRSGRGWCASRRRTGGMRIICWSCWRWSGFRRLGTQCGGARSAATAVASAQAGADADRDQESAAACSDEPGVAEEASAVEQAGTAMAETVSTATVDGAAERGFAAV